MKNILFILGTSRAGRKNEVVAKHVVAVAKRRGDIKPTFVDVRDFPQTSTGGLSPEKTKELDALIRAAKGLVIISPEYNHGYPGELKLFLDNAYQAYEGKPVSICAVSDGPIGGARMTEQLKLVLSAFQMIIINVAVYFANVDEVFDKTGKILPATYWNKRINGMLDQVLKYAK